jgi:hypothetical protein
MMVGRATPKKNFARISDPEPGVKITSDPGPGSATMLDSNPERCCMFTIASVTGSTISDHFLNLLVSLSHCTTKLILLDSLLQEVVVTLPHLVLQRPRTAKMREAPTGAGTKGVGRGPTLAWPGWKQPDISVKVDTARLEADQFKKCCMICVLLYYPSTEFQSTFNVY